jgi:two-component sensor histidine kinase
LIALRLATKLARTEANRELLINELNHRVKNAFATLQGLVVSTLRSAGSFADGRKAVEERIVALGRAHDVLTEEHWEGADLCELALSILQPYRGDPQRVRVAGPDLRVNPRAAVSLAMVLNELMTNAAKHGSLAQPEGIVELEWALTGERPMQLQLVWTERGGTIAAPPTRRGFGSTLIQQSIERELGGSFRNDFDSAGLTYTIALPLGKVRA